MDIRDEKNRAISERINEDWAWDGIYLCPDMPDNDRPNACQCAICDDGKPIPLDFTQPEGFAKLLFNLKKTWIVTFYWSADDCCCQIQIGMGDKPPMFNSRAKAYPEALMDAFLQAEGGGK